MRKSILKRGISLLCILCMVVLLPINAAAQTDTQEAQQVETFAKNQDEKVGAAKESQPQKTVSETVTKEENKPEETKALKNDEQTVAAETKSIEKTEEEKPATPEVKAPIDENINTEQKKTFDKTSKALTDGGVEQQSEEILPVRGSNVSQKTDVTVTKFEIIKDGNPATSLKIGSSYELRLNWDASAYGNTLHAGDYFIVNLPDEFKFPTNHSATRFSLYDENGAVVANAVVNSGGNMGGGTVTATFTDYVENRHGVKGNMYLAFSLVKEKVIPGETNEFSITIGAQTFVISVEVQNPSPANPINPNEVLSKWASRGESTDDYVQWSSRINFAGKNIGKATLSDSLSVMEGEGQSRFIPSSFVLEECIFDEYGNKTKTINRWDFSRLGGRLRFNADFTSFELDIDIAKDKQFRLKYRTTYSPGQKIRNQMKLISREGVWPSEYTYQDVSSGGSGEGTLNGKIKVIKSDTFTAQRLEGAQFRIVNKATDEEFTLISGENGEAVSDKLVAGEYTVAEVVPPEGYLVDETSYPVTVSADGLATVEISNAPEPISIPVEKKWIGPKADKATVDLYADGEVVATAELTEAVNWKHTFTGLQKNSPADGHIIEYDVVERPIDGYEPEYGGNAETGFTITNRNIETIDIPVQKVWIGPIPEDEPHYMMMNSMFVRNEEYVVPRFTVYVVLLADSRYKSGAYLTEEDGYRYTFTGLPKYDQADGHEIFYDIVEPYVPRNYIPKVEGNAQTGFTVTNTNVETVDIPVKKQWVGAEGDAVVVGLYADGRLIDEAELNAQNGWQYVFLRHWKYNAVDGHEIVYSVKEKPVEGYSVSYGGDVKNGFVITNTEIVRETLLPPLEKDPIEEVQVKKNSVTKDPVGKSVPKTVIADDVSPKTGDFSSFMLYFVLAVIGAGAVAWIVIVYFKGKNK